MKPPQFYDRCEGGCNGWILTDGLPHQRRYIVKMHTVRNPADGQELRVCPDCARHYPTPPEQQPQKPAPEPKPKPAIVITGTAKPLAE